MTLIANRLPGAGVAGSKIIVSAVPHTATVVAVAVGVRVVVGDPVGVGVRVALGTRVFVGGGRQDEVGVRVGALSGVGVCNGELNSVVGLLVGLGVAVRVGVGVGVGVTVGAMEMTVGATVTVGVSVAEGVSIAAAVPVRSASGSEVVIPAARRARASPTTMAQMVTITKRPSPTPRISSRRSGGAAACCIAAL